jgi:hypothetical protein
VLARNWPPLRCTSWGKTPAKPARLPQLASAIEAIRDISNIPIMVGGYLFQGRPGLAGQLGADGCAADAEAALAVASGLVPPPS